MKMYTAQEMRVRADYLEGALADAKTAAMLRQAAGAMEREATREESSQVGNAAAMREALEKAQSVIATCIEIITCKARRPCTDLRHDWMPPKNEAR